MTLFQFLYYICIFTIITFYEYSYAKRALKEMSFQIKCFVMKLAFYHLASYAEKLRIAAEEVTVDITDVQIDNWVAVNYENNWFPGVVFNIQSINFSHSIFTITFLTHFILLDNLKLVRKRELKICLSCGGLGRKEV